MPRVALTDAAVKRLKPGSERVDYFDKGYPGLVLRIGPRSRTWVYFARVGKKLVRHHLGSYPAQSLAEARELWRAAREQVQAGKPPRASLRSRDAIETVIADWLKRDQAELATYPEVKRAFDTVIVPAWSGRPITSIDRRDVLDVLDAVADRGKVGRANKLHAWMNRLMTWSVGRGILAASPMAGLPKPGEAVVRDRALSDVEIAAVWRAARTIGWPYGTVVQMLLLTLAREAEIAELVWTEIDAGAACIRLDRERTKNDTARVIALPPLAWRIVAGSPKVAGCPFVFPSGAGKPITGWSKYKQRLDGLTGINQPWRLHDFRRTGRTRLSAKAMGVPYEVREAALGHKKKGLDRVYDGHDYLPEMHDALGKWGAYVLGLVG